MRIYKCTLAISSSEKNKHFIIDIEASTLNQAAFKLFKKLKEEKITDLYIQEIVPGVSKKKTRPAKRINQ